MAGNEQLVTTDDIKVLGVLPPAPDLHAIADLAGMTTAVTKQSLRRLVRRRMVGSTGGGKHTRYFSLVLNSDASDAKGE